MTHLNPDSLVSTEWLAARLTAPDLRIVDASFKMPGVTPTAREDYLAAHIPGATFFDIDEIADPETDLPHMLPSPAKFASRMRGLGLGDGNRIVVYDGNGILGAARAWWMLRTFGHTDVVILDGGLKTWVAEGRPVDDLPPPPRDRHFTARFQALQVRDREQMLANLESGREQVIDARAAPRFEGTVPEPRPGLRAGHIPGSLNLDHARLIDPATGRVRPPEVLKTLFAEAGLAPSKPVIATCGSGVSACVLAFGLHLLGREDVAIYDGSWADWGRPGATPVATGKA